MVIEFCNLKKQSGDTELRGIPHEQVFILDVKTPPDLGENKFQKIPPYFENSPRSGGKRL